MKLLNPVYIAVPFTGVPSFARTALPLHGQTMLQSKSFSKILYPARYCTRASVAEAIRDRRTL